MKRRAFNILSAISLLVCLATAALWVTGIARHIYIDAGGAGYSGTERWGIGMDFIIEVGNQQALGVEWSSSDDFSGIHVPYWLLIVSAAVMPAWWVWRRSHPRSSVRGFPIEAKAASEAQTPDLPPAPRDLEGDR